MGLTTTPADAAAETVRIPRAVEWQGGRDGELRLLDQTLLPARVEHLTCRTAAQVHDAIRRLAVRGAPAIGVAAAYGLAVATRAARETRAAEFMAALREAGEYLCGARPTAVNLSWAVRRVTAAAEKSGCVSAGELWDVVLSEARRIAEEDAAMCRAIGEAGAGLIREGMGVLTHCNAGALATAGIGTALAPLYVAQERGVRFRVFADETRPLMQGSRLTAYELSAAGIDVTVMCDDVAGWVMKSGRIQLVIVGADRIAANGDTANKIGTYGLAVLARHHGIPFYVAAPSSTFDLSIRSGREIPIEERSEEEVRRGLGGAWVASGAGCMNPAFDVTPAELITGMITEKGRSEPVSERNIAKIFGSGA